VDITGILNSEGDDDELLTLRKISGRVTLKYGDLDTWLHAWIGIIVSRDAFTNTWYTSGGGADYHPYTEAMEEFTAGPFAFEVLNKELNYLTQGATYKWYQGSFSYTVPKQARELFQAPEIDDADPVNLAIILGMHESNGNIGINPFLHYHLVMERETRDIADFRI
jgi:hypothetical protein